MLSPFITRAIDILATLTGVLIVNGRDNKSSTWALNSGFIVTAITRLIFFYAIALRIMNYIMRFWVQVMCMASVFTVVIVVKYYTGIKTNLFKILPVTLRAAQHWVSWNVFPAAWRVLSGELSFWVSSLWLEIGWAAVACKVFTISPQQKWASKK